MKILWQAYDTVHYTSGPIVNAVRLMPEFVSRGHEVRVVMQYHVAHPSADLLRKLGIPVHVFQTPKSSREHVVEYLEQLVDFQPDVFVSNISAYAGLAGRWAVEAGIPVIHTHRSDDELNNGMAEFFFTGPKEWRLSGLACVNSYLLDQVRKKSKDPFAHRIIPSGVPASQYRSEQKSEPLRIVYAGRLIQQQKRIFDVLSRFIDLAGKIPNIECTIIGSGDEQIVRQLKERVEASSMTNRISFTGKLEGDHYKQALARNHFILMLSDYEGTPGSIMDAMSCGVIPIVKRIPGIDDLVKHGENGILISDGEDLAEIITNIGNDRERLSVNAVSTIDKAFSIKHTADEWEAFFKDVISGAGPRKQMEMPRDINLPTQKHSLIQYNPETAVEQSPRPKGLWNYLKQKIK